MAKVSPLQGDFTGGEFSPLAHGHVNTDRYKTGLDTCLNYIPTVQGALVRRPGGEFLFEARDSNAYSRLIPFKFNTEQIYIIELCQIYVPSGPSTELGFRVYNIEGIPQFNYLFSTISISAITNASQCVVTSAGHGLSNGDRVYITGVVGMIELNNREFAVSDVTANTFKIKTVIPFSYVDSTNYGVYASSGSIDLIDDQLFNVGFPSVSQIDEIEFLQSGDVLYLFHKDFHPQRILRFDDGTLRAGFSLEETKDGPYLPINQTGTTLTPSATTGSITITASAIDGINNNTGFILEHSGVVGRRIELNGGYAVVTATNSTTQVVATVIRTLTTTTATTAWRLGVWCYYEGYPSRGCFYEDRLCVSGYRRQVQRLDFSVTSSYEDFSYHDSSLSINQDNAFFVQLNSSDLNEIMWTLPDEKGLLVGTAENEWVVKGDGDTPISGLAGGASGRISTSYGSSAVTPVKLSKSVIYAQRSGRKVREMFFDYNSYGFKSPELTPLAEHITSSGLKQLAAQKEGQPIAWAIKNNGGIIGITLDRELDTLIAGWHRHELGGNYAGGSPIVKSIISLPSEDSSFEQAYFLTTRTINGVTRRYAERLADFFIDTTDKELAWHMDCALQYDNPISDITFSNASECLATTISNHGLVDDDEVYITEVLGMTELNNNRYVVDVISPTTFKLKDYSGNYIDSSSYGTQVVGTYGTYREYITTISGLWHLEGETVNVFADGGVRPDETVSDGKIVLNDKATTILIGYNFTSKAKMLRLEAGSQDGTALGKTRRINKCAFFLHRTAGLKTGPDFDNLHAIKFPDSGSERGVPLFSGIISDTMDADYDFENKLCWQQDQPFPSTILAVLPQMTTQDGG